MTAPVSYALEHETAREHISNALQLLQFGERDAETRQAVLRRLRLALAALTPEAA